MSRSRRASSSSGVSTPSFSVVPSATTRVHGTCAAITACSIGENMRALAGSVSTAKNAFLCGSLQRKVLATQTARGSYALHQRRALVGPLDDVVDQDATVDEVDLVPVSDQRRAVELEVARIADDRRHAGRDERVAQDLELGPGRHVAPVDDRDGRRLRRAAPLAIAVEQRVEQRLDRLVEAHAVRFTEPRHHRQRVEQLGQPLGVAGAGRRLGVVFGEVQAVGQQERVEARRGARRLIPRIDADQPLFGLGDAELLEQRARGDRLTRHTLADRRDRLGRRAGSRASSAASERTAAGTGNGCGRRTSASAPASMPANASAYSARQLVAGPQQRVPARAIGVGHLQTRLTLPGAPVNPVAGPMPSISSHRGQHCDGWPFSARSTTSCDIFSTTMSK